MIRKNIQVIIIGLLFALSMPKTYAQGPPIFTDTPIMLGLDGRGIRTFGRVINKEKSSAYLHVFAIPFNITSKWQVGMIAPFLRKSPNGLASNSGFGDMKIFTKYQLVQKDGKGKTFRVLAKLTETFPTGNTTEAPNIGAGINQTTLSLVAGNITTKYGLYGEFGYNITSDNTPDNFIYNLAISIPLLPQKYPPSQLNISIDFNGNLNVNDNINTIFISPGLQFIVGRKVLFETGIQIPLIQSNLIANKTNNTITLGTRILLF